MAACTQPGCTGAIVDGYCDICGSPPDAAPVTAPVVPGDVSTSTRTSSRLASTAIGSARGRTGVTRRVGTASRRLRAARLGAGLTTVAPQPPIDPVHAILTDPQVAEEKRFCPSCGAPVGRSIDGRPGRTEGFCPQCRTKYSFDPTLAPGDLVGGQYEVAGALAHGGLGWIYLARDRNVSDRWVVLKGLLNTGDADAQAAAIAERQFLAQVEHPRIVEIYNFAVHDGAGYTVMEYVGGISLKQILKDRMAAAGRYDPFPLDQAIAFVLEILPAFEYLHDLGLVFCDFKPDNLIQVGDDVKLIDLGGVRRFDDADSAIYGTVGYQAPEVPTDGVSVASDVYTIGRTLLVLAMEFRGYQSTYVASLPPVGETPLFQRYDAFYRLVAKACAPDPADRFATVAELRVQLHGVLREVVATDRGDAAATLAAPSLNFAAPDVAASELTWRDIPRLLVDPGDPQSGWLATLGVEDPQARLAALAQAPERSPEVVLAQGRAALLAGQAPAVAPLADELLAADPWEWRAVWLQGLAALVANDGPAAQAAFNAVYGQVPGELAPKLALALACEHTGELDIADALYSTCARTDAAYVPPAAFALARIRATRASVGDAVAALELVPATSRAYPEARFHRAEALLATNGGLPALAEAMASIEVAGIDPKERLQVAAAVLSRALGEVRRTGPQPAIMIGRWRAVEPVLRDGLEETYRALAQVTDEPSERVALVDAANGVRRWTML
ncbi:serine/threonine-protein kinase PknG [Actinotalea sp. M2MS4P-6]|uniref:serine/threonine-protein kinase n=1 Tax=Actinotalea sp. M2MS4P-6 TaxID=2983762 RepID=UPI0021E47BAA|nr:serine/threonine-protein kinase [Actinotalea sp. M2MS4P-6]MCV2393046.1 serine/threonine-protein kinase PknG [Actinotalea sp. M2MS4P-6]